MYVYLFPLKILFGANKNCNKTKQNLFETNENYNEGK